MKKYVISMIILLILIFGAAYFCNSKFKKNNKDNEKRVVNGPTFNVEASYDEEVIEKNNSTDVIITAVGDCTLGYDDNFGYTNSFNEVYEHNGADHFFGGVKNIFENDDITIANLEGTLTDATLKKEKAFNFKAPKNYVEILNKGDIEVVNIANNHTYDYNEVGFIDTKNTLTSANVGYFGYNDYYVFEKEDIKIGLAGIFCIEDWSCTKKIDQAISDLNAKEVDSIVLSFHWGIEKDYKQSQVQKYLGHYAIDHGVDLVLGHHPHVLQGIENYNGKYIVYSLANFSFGGNKNPSDKDTMVFQIKIKYENSEIINTEMKVYPASVSSVNNKNDYRPTLLEGEDAMRVLNKIQQYSEGVSLIS